ncbi:hypothetical protein N7G274_004939 [Stereocaulon virgatum]|uniref:Uncharacterized protein n=1 Tax=Stereocaulon virgatum TaxID=373712 RepID=A0ABR4A980_9LECA
MPLADPRGRGFKDNVLNGLWRAQRYAQTPRELKIFSVRNRVVNRPSSNLVDFKRIMLDVITPDFFGAPGKFDIATIHGDLTWGTWTSHLVDFRPFETQRFDVTFTRSELVAILDQDEALARLLALGAPGPWESIQLCRAMVYGVYRIAYVFKSPSQTGVLPRYDAILADPQNGEVEHQLGISNPCTTMGAISNTTSQNESGFENLNLGGAATS